MKNNTEDVDEFKAEAARVFRALYAAVPTDTHYAADILGILAFIKSVLPQCASHFEGDERDRLMQELVKEFGTLLGKVGEAMGLKVQVTTMGHRAPNDEEMN